MTERDAAAELETILGDDTPFFKHEAAILMEAAAEIRRLRDALRDFADNGVRADLNPTGTFTSEGVFEPNGGWHGYLKRIDEHVREHAEAALEMKDG